MALNNATAQDAATLYRNASRCGTYAIRTLRIALYSADELASAAVLADSRLGRKADKVRAALTKLIEEVDGINTELAGK